MGPLCEVKEFIPTTIPHTQCLLFKRDLLNISTLSIILYHSLMTKRNLHKENKKTKKNGLRNKKLNNVVLISNSNAKILFFIWIPSMMFSLTQLMLPLLKLFKTYKKIMKLLLL